MLRRLLRITRRRSALDRRSVLDTASFSCALLEAEQQRTLRTGGDLCPHGQCSHSLTTSSFAAAEAHRRDTAHAARDQAQQQSGAWEQDEGEEELDLSHRQAAHAGVKPCSAGFATAQLSSHLRREPSQELWPAPLAQRKSTQCALTASTGKKRLVILLATLCSCQPSAQGLGDSYAVPHVQGRHAAAGAGPLCRAGAFSCAADSPAIWSLAALQQPWPSDSPAAWVAFLLVLTVLAAGAHGAR